MNSSISDLVTRLAMGLTLRLFPEDSTLADVRFLANARMHLWPDWSNLDTRSRLQVAEFLSRRPNELSEYRLLLCELRKVLQVGDDFEPLDSDKNLEPTWQTTYRLVPGASLESRIEDWIEALKKKSLGKPLGGVTVNNGRELILRGGGQYYLIPPEHVSSDHFLTLQLKTADAPRSIVLNRNELAALARKIDGRDGDFYHKHAVKGFLDCFVSKDETSVPVQVFDAGITNLGIAPTGTGKSIFIRLLALHLAAKGIISAIVVPDIHTAWKEVLRLRKALANADLNLKVVPISSWRKLAHQFAAHLKYPPQEDSDGKWALQNVSYVCHLSAYAEDPDSTPAMGEEPCSHLRQLEKVGSSGARVQCPYIRQCGRFSAFEEAGSADILVINHHAFLSGRVPVPVSIDNSPPRKVSTAEMVFRLCGAVFIDEIDALQSAAVSADSGGLELSPQGEPPSRPSQLYMQVEGKNDPDIEFDRGRYDFLQIISLAGKLTEAVNKGAINWPYKGRMTWTKANDAEIAAKLFDGHESGLEQVNQLFKRDGLIENPIHKKLREVLIYDLRDGASMPDIRRNVMEALKDFTFNKHNLQSQQKERDKFADLLIIRAILNQLDHNLGYVRRLLPVLEQKEFALAGEIRDTLLGYAPWQPSPVGALGKRIYGYSFSNLDNNQGVLETRAMAGDPHGFIRELGDMVAMSLAGRQRVVVGFSATCRFPGSPKADVLGRTAGWVRDKDDNVRVSGAEVEARISGVKSREKRLKAARSAAEELWYSTLSSYLDRMVRDEHSTSRARAMLVTGSYEEARAVYRGLKKVAGQELKVCYLVSDSERENSNFDALPRKKLETFGHIRAPAVLVGPLSVVARGHNILQPGTDKSALSGIFVLTRPVPPSHDAGRFLAHIAYNVRMSPPDWEGTPGTVVDNERRLAWSRLHALLRSPATFRYMDKDLRRELVCDVLVDLSQLAGRARRGGTPVDLVFVDGAFQDEVVPWQDLVSEVLGWWEENGWLNQMLEMQGAFVKGLAEYAGFTPRETNGV